MTKFIIKLDKDKCIGCGSCAAVCPANFEIGDNNKVSVKQGEVDSLGCNQVAAESCPVQAINVKPIGEKKNEASPEAGEEKKETGE